MTDEELKGLPLDEEKAGGVTAGLKKPMLLPGMAPDDMSDEELKCAYARAVKHRDRACIARLEEKLRQRGWIRNRNNKWSNAKDGAAPDKTISMTKMPT